MNTATLFSENKKNSPKLIFATSACQENSEQRYNIHTHNTKILFNIVGQLLDYVVYLYRMEQSKKVRKYFLLSTEDDNRLLIKSAKEGLSPTDWIEAVVIKALNSVQIKECVDIPDEPPVVKKTRQPKTYTIPEVHPYPHGVLREICSRLPKEITKHIHLEPITPGKLVKKDGKWVLEELDQNKP